MLPAVVGQVPVGVGVVRKDRSIAYRNDELARILRLDPAPRAEEWRLPGFLRLGGIPCASEQDPLTLLLDTGRPKQRSEVTLERQDGSRAEVAVTLTPIVEKDGPVVGAVIYAEDLTEEAEEASLHEAFVGVLSHELRTPITSIYGGAQLLLQDRMPSEVRETVVTDIAAEAEQLFRLVEDLLAITRLERGAPEADGDPVLLQRLAQQAARAEERRWPGRHVLVTAETDLAAVRANDGLTMQVLRNLISDAVKYSPADETVEILLTSEEDGVRVVVLDRGPGFPPETGADAFQLFHHSPGVAGRVPGTGIGLYVARALVEAQGGRIWLRDRPGGGTEAGFALPRYEP
ncbi:MAG: ATP-binding protein [Candidatus Limnocylindrales bacterium]